MCFLFCSCLYVSLFLSWKMLKFSWIDLAQLDSELTKHEVDSNEAVSHKICAFGPTQSSRLQLESLRAAMEDSYRLSKLFCLSSDPYHQIFSNDQGFTSFGVFVKKCFRCNEILPGLTVFLAPILKEEIISGYNNVSIFQHHTGEKMMLGGVAFIDSSCKPNPMYSYNRQMPA